MSKKTSPLSHQAAIIGMLSFVWTLGRLVQRVTAYDAVCKAITDPSRIPSLVKQLTDLRKTSLALLIALVAFYIQDNRVMAAGWVTALILLTYNICSMYDSIDDEVFIARIDAMGPAMFSLVNTSPGFAVPILLSVELIIKSESPGIGALQTLLAFSPGLLQAFGETLSFFCQPVTTDGELPRYDDTKGLSV